MELFRYSLPDPTLCEQSYDLLDGREYSRIAYFPTLAFWFEFFFSLFIIKCSWIFCMLMSASFVVGRNGGFREIRIWRRNLCCVLSAVYVLMEKLINFYVLFLKIWGTSLVGCSSLGLRFCFVMYPKREYILRMRCTIGGKLVILGEIKWAARKQCLIAFKHLFFGDFN